MDPIVFRLDATINKSHRGRVTYESLAPARKYEYTIKCRLTPLQHALYSAYLKQNGLVDGEGQAAVLSRFHSLLLIINHPGIAYKVLMQSKAKSGAQSPNKNILPTPNGTSEDSIAGGDALAIVPDEMPIVLGENSADYVHDIENETEDFNDAAPIKEESYVHHVIIQTDIPRAQKEMEMIFGEFAGVF
jgi:hypothetical protein